MTQDTFSFARPYAKAAFNQAVADQQFEPWLLALQALRVITSDPQVQALIHDPRVAHDALAAFILKVGQAYFTPAAQNFIRLLVEKKRVNLAADIEQLFEQYVAEYHQTVEVQVTSFTPLSVTQKSQLTDILTQRLQRKVDMYFSEDSQLLGGAVIRAGNLVIDGSLRHKLVKLRNQLVA